MMNVQVEHIPSIQPWNRGTLRLLDIRKHWLDQGECATVASLSTYILVLVVRGKGMLRFNNVPRTCNGLYVVHGCRHSALELIAEQQLEYYCIHYTVQGGSDTYAQPDNAESEFGYTPASSLCLYRLVEQLYNQWLQPDNLEQLRITSLLYSLILEVFTQRDQENGNLLTGPTDRIGLALGYLRQCYRKSLALTEIAEAAGCSTRRLSQLFSERLGMTPAQVLSAIRMQKAAELLRNTDATLQTIAEDVGYGTGYSLSRHFKKIVRLSPNEYRKQTKWNAQADPLDETPLYTEKLQAYMSIKGSEYPSRATEQEQMSILQTTNDHCTKSGFGTYFRPLLHTRTVPTVMGLVQVPEHPIRIVVDWNVGHLAALGLSPIGAPRSLIENNKLLDPYWNAVPEDIGFHNQISLDRIVDLEPDLIVTWNRDAYPAYARIAPTLVFEADRYGGSQEEILTMARMINREREAAEWISASRERTHALRSRLDTAIDSSATFTLVDPCWHREVTVIGNTAFRGGKAVYERLGALPPARVARDILQQGLDSAKIIHASVDTYIGDYALVLTYEPSMGLDISPDWDVSRIADRHRIIELPWNHFFQSDPFSSLLQAEVLAKKLLKER